VLYLRLIIFSVGGDIPIDNEVLLMTDFMNLKIKSVQSFGCAHRSSLYVYIHMDECSYIYEYLRLCCVSKIMLGTCGCAISALWESQTNILVQRCDLSFYYIVGRKVRSFFYYRIY
jgi:hypothetical protein